MHYRELFILCIQIVWLHAHSKVRVKSSRSVLYQSEVVDDYFTTDALCVLSTAASV